MKIPNKILFPRFSQLIAERKNQLFLTFLLLNLLTLFRRLSILFT